MPQSVTASDLARHTSEVLDRVEAGESVVIERRGVPIGRLEPTRPTGAGALGRLAGRGRQTVGDEELTTPLPDWPSG